MAYLIYHKKIRMKTIITLLSIAVFVTSCEKSQQIMAPNNTAVTSATSFNNEETGLAFDGGANKNLHHGMKSVTVDLSGFEFLPNYSWTLTFSRVNHHNETYTFKGNTTDGYVHTNTMPQGSYTVTLNEKTTAEVSYIFYVFTKNDNANLANALNIEMYYNDTTATQTVQELASNYEATASGR
jgi:hypothetical protein